MFRLNLLIILIANRHAKASIMTKMISDKLKAPWKNAAAEDEREHRKV